MTFSPLRIVSARTFTKRLEFRMDVAHSLASRFYSDNIYVELCSDSDTAGYGECVPRPYVTGETPESVIDALDDLLPQLTDEEFASPEAVIDRLTGIGGSDTGRRNPAALCAAELALLDLAGKRWNRPVAAMLGLGRLVNPLAYSLVAPLLPPGAMEPFLAYASGFRFGQVKVKVDGRDPSGQVRRARDLLPPGIEIRVDANCSWTAATAPRYMREMADEGVVSVEQPLPAEDLDGTARLRGEGPLITLDESVSGPDDVARAAEAGACDVVNVRISKCGGLLGALRVIGAAERHGLGVQLGAQVGESCILSAAGAALAAGMPRFRWLEGCFGTHLLREDLCDDAFQFGMRGMLVPPDGPGLGVAVNRAHLAAG